VKSLDPTEIAQIQNVLAHARAGKATLAQLATAHDLAEEGALNSVLGELRSHIRTMVPAPFVRIEVKGLLIGVASGLVTHLLLNSPYLSRTAAAPRKINRWH
jgi:hypothetical protein